MQNKGAVRLFAILLALVTIYQLSFTYVTYKVRKDAKEAAAEYVKNQLTDIVEDQDLSRFIL